MSRILFALGSSRAPADPDRIASSPFGTGTPVRLGPWPDHDHLGYREASRRVDLDPGPRKRSKPRGGDSTWHPLKFRQLRSLAPPVGSLSGCGATSTWARNGTELFNHVGTRLWLTLWNGFEPMGDAMPRYSPPVFKYGISTP